MELKLEHLTPYLPFKLKVLQGGYDKKIVDLIGIRIETPSVQEMIIFKNDRGNTMSGYFYETKPLLRPLDTLKRPITHNGKTFIPLHELLKDNCFNLEQMTEERINEFEQTFMDAYSWSYKDVITLCSWHYDIFNLIQKGLAEKIKEKAKQTQA